MNTIDRKSDSWVGRPIVDTSYLHSATDFKPALLLIDSSRISKRRTEYCNAIHLKLSHSSGTRGEKGVERNRRNDVSQRELGEKTVSATAQSSRNDTSRFIDWLHMLYFPFDSVQHDAWPYEAYCRTKDWMQERYRATTTRRVVDREILHEWRAGHSWSPPSCRWNAYIMVVKSFQPTSARLAPASASANHARHVTSQLNHVTALRLPLHDQASRHDRMTSQPADCASTVPYSFSSSCRYCCYLYSFSHLPFFDESVSNAPKLMWRDLQAIRTENRLEM